MSTPNVSPNNSILNTFYYKNTLVVFFILCTFFIQAQVKVGDNPTTIDPNSLLELEHTAKGILIPRVELNDATTVAPLVGSVPEGMLIYNETGSEEHGFYYWDGSEFRMIQTSLNNEKRDNYVLVKSTADLPAASSGIITLAAGTVYEINGTIGLTDQINLNGSYIVGLDANNDILNYSASSGALFTGRNGGTIKNVTLVAANAGSKVFDLDDVTAAKNLIVRDCIIANSSNIGNVKGFNIAFFDIINFSGNTNGITYEDVTNLLLENLAWFSNNSNTYETYVGTFSVIERLGGFADALSSNSATILDISGITAISNGELKTGTYRGDGTRVAGTFTKEWEVDAQGLHTEIDDAAGANLYLTSDTLVTIGGVSSPIKIDGAAIATNLFRFTSPVSSRLMYDGTKTRSFTVSASMSMTSPSGARFYSFFIAKNGVVLPETAQQRKVGGTDLGSVTITGVVELAPTDYVEIWVQNNLNGVSVRIENMNISVK